MTCNCGFHPPAGCPAPCVGGTRFCAACSDMACLLTLEGLPEESPLVGVIHTLVHKLLLCRAQLFEARTLPRKHWSPEDPKVRSLQDRLASCQKNAKSLTAALAKCAKTRDADGQAYEKRYREQQATILHLTAALDKARKALDARCINPYHRDAEDCCTYAEDSRTYAEPTPGGSP